MDAAELLAGGGIDAHVVHVPTIKPLDTDGLVAAAEHTGRVVTIEEHSVIGGLGGAVAECLSEHRPTRVHRIGIETSSRSRPPHQALLDIYGLTAERVVDRVRDLLADDAGDEEPVMAAAG